MRLMIKFFLILDFIARKFLEPYFMLPAKIYNRLGVKNYKDNDFNRALYFFNKALRLSEFIFPHSPDTAICLSWTAATYNVLGDMPKALEQFQKALRIDESRAPRSTQTAIRLSSVGTTYLYLGDFDQALIYCERV